MCTYIAIKIMSLESGGNGKDEKEETVLDFPGF